MAHILGNGPPGGLYQVLVVAAVIFPPKDAFTAYVVFVGTDTRPPWRLFTTRGYRHVFVMVPVYPEGTSLLAAEYVMCLNPQTNCIQHSVVKISARDAAQHFLKEGATCVIKVRVDRRGLAPYIPRGLQTCVSVVKSVLGVAAWYVWTPQHLARWLVRNGGQIIEKET